MRLRAQLGQTTIVALLVAMFVTMFAAPARAQVLNSGASTITLQAVLSQSVTLTLSGNAVNFNLTGGSANNPGSTSITATTAWTLKPSMGSLKVYAFFSNSALALTDGAGNNIRRLIFKFPTTAARLLRLPIRCPLVERTQACSYRPRRSWATTRPEPATT